MPTRWSRAPLPCNCTTCREEIDEGETVGLVESTQPGELLLICALCAEARNPDHDEDIDWSGWATD